MTNRTASYIDMCRETAIYPHKGEGTTEAVNYCIIGLVGEAGEIANKWKKILRGDITEDADIRAVARAIHEELGDVLWYATRLAEELNSDLVAVMNENEEKLLSRQARNKLRGEGDNR